VVKEMNSVYRQMGDEVVGFGGGGGFKVLWGDKGTGYSQTG